MPTSAIKPGLPEPSITVPFVIIRSYSGLWLDTEDSVTIVDTANRSTNAILTLIDFHAFT
jgi:hypothetical protein